MTGITLVSYKILLDRRIALLGADPRYEWLRKQFVEARLIIEGQIIRREWRLWAIWTAVILVAAAVVGGLAYLVF